MLSVGDKAPAFTLPDQDGNPVSLEDFAGSKVVVYFYPRDNTPGCTRQACAFRDSYQVYRERNIAVIGISKDSVKSHRGFADKQNLPFILLSDPEHKVIEAFGAWQEKKQYGKTFMGTVRYLHGDCPLHLCAGRNRDSHPRVPQSKTGHQRRGNPRRFGVKRYGMH